MSAAASGPPPRPDVAIQLDPVWPELLDALNTYKLAYDWNVYKSQDGTYWGGVLLDDDAARASLETVRSIRSDLTLRHAAAEVRWAVAAAARLVLDGTEFYPGRDPSGTDYEPHGRPSTAVVEAIAFDCARETYVELSDGTARSEHDALRSQRDQLATTGFPDSARALDVLVRALHSLIEPNETELDARPVPPLLPAEQGELPSWIPNGARHAGVSVPTNRGPVTVRLISAAALQASYRQAPTPLKAQRDVERQEQARAVLAVRLSFIDAAKAEGSDVGARLLKAELRGDVALEDALAVCQTMHRQIDTDFNGPPF